MEMEVKEGLDVVSKAPANMAASSPATIDADKPMEEVAQEPDFSTLSKKELVDILKELVRGADFKKADNSLREIRNQFDEIQDKEKSDALKRFIELGGSPDDFEYRHDALDISFEANFKILRNKRTEHFRSLEELKNDNHRKKNTLLDELRSLVDGEDTKHSFEKFKGIQRQWKEIGTVPLAHLRQLWANYHALVDRFYDNRNIYFELKELDRKKNLEAKLELCQRAESLATVDKINVAIRELNELHEDYRHVGPVEREEKEIVWERFKKASDAVYERRDEAVSQLQAELAKNLALKDQIVASVTELSNFQSDRIKEWNQKTADILAIQKDWGSVGTVARSKSKEINKRFWSAFKLFFANKGHFFEKLDQSRLENLAKKKELVVLAEALKINQDWEKTSNELKALQIKWREIGPAPDKHREKIYKEFKGACDFFFEQRRLKIEEADQEQSDNLAKKKAICVELEVIINDKNGSLEKLKELQRSFHAIGFVPRDAVDVKSRFSSLFQKALASLEQVSQEEKDQAMLEIQLENLKTDPDAVFKIQQKEQGLRKRIQKEENDLAILKNNLEFFGRSKNASKVKAEFGEKVSAAETMLSQLKQQLKQLRAATR